MKRHYRRYRPKRRRRSRLSSSNWGPILALLGTVIGILGVAALVVFVALPKLLPLVGISYTAPFMPTPTPGPTAVPVATAYPMELFDPQSAQAEIVFTDSGSYRWFSDPYCYDGQIMLSAGNLDDNNNAVLTDLLLYDPESRTAEKLPYSPANTHIMYARFNADWIVYLDANFAGGGAIMAVNRSDANAKPVLVKDIYTGQPELVLSGNYLAFTDRTGSKMDKLFVVDLSTMESVTVAMFSSSVYGQSTPDLRGTLLTWADTSNVSDSGEMISIIYHMNLNASTTTSYEPGTYVHDPQGDGSHTAWLNGHHGADTSLYCCTGAGAPMLVADGVTDFSLQEEYIAYGMNEAVYAYVFDTGKSYLISPEHQLTQFLGASDGKIFWLDVTTRDVGRDIVMFAELPI